MHWTPGRRSVCIPTRTGRAPVRAGVGWTTIVHDKIENLLQDAGRTRELVTGWVCALIGVTFTAIFLWLLWLVAWRNPRENDVHDLGKWSTLAILGLLLSIAAGFSVIAFRLIWRSRTRSGLLSPISLRVWGSFFAIGSAVVLAGAIATKKWLAVPHYWAAACASGYMAWAAFALARRRARSGASHTETSQGGPANGSQPIRSETNRASSAAGSRR
jgi:hypothetical protein